MDVLFLLFFATSVRFVVPSYFIGEQLTPWGNQSCQQAVPRLNYSQTKLFLDSTVNVSNLNISSDGVWIGYFQAWVTYTFVGCSRVNESESKTYDVHNLGDCMSATGCQTIGTWQSNTTRKCSCAEGLTIMQSQKCNTYCNATSCDSTENTVVSVYTNELTNISEPDLSCANCRCLCFKYHSNQKQFKWIGCRGHFNRVLCSNKSYTDGFQTPTQTNSSPGTWITAMDSCFNERKYPTTYRNILKGVFTNAFDQNHWTGIIRRESSIKIIGKAMSFIPKRYAVLLNNGTVVFTNDSTVTKTTLCSQDGTSAMSSKATASSQLTTVNTKDSTSASSSISTVSSQLTKNQEPTHTSSITSTTRLTRTANTNTTYNLPTNSPTVNTTTTAVSHPLSEGTMASFDKDNESKVGLVAALSVSVILALVAALIVLLVLRKRGKLPKCFKQNCERSNHSAKMSSKIKSSKPIFESSSNKTTTDDLTSTNHSFFILEKTFEKNEKDEGNHYAEPETSDDDHYDLTDTSHKYMDNDYETTHHKNESAMSRLAKQKNNYNKVSLTQTETDEYDHIHRNERLPKSDRETENEYDISNEVIDGKRIELFGHDNDTYNHLNQQDMKSSYLDEINGKQATDDSGYDTSRALKYSRNADAQARQNDYAVIKKW